ncbi:transposase, partial [Enterococcus faecium]|uniref:transposase n=1 Tax=Enterococcus faecium TaxID=1352 RepID=UPI004044EA1C
MIGNPSLNHRYRKGFYSLFKTLQQNRCIHVSRNIAHKVRVKDRKEICDDFKAVYQANSKEEA